MQVETYIHEPKFPEINDKGMEELELTSALEALQLRQELCEQENLQHQIKLVQHEIDKVAAKIASLKNGVPYPLLTYNQWKILQSYFWSQENVSDFDMGLMPYETLQTYRSAKRLGVFHEITVAYRDNKKDPLLLGWNQKWETPFLLSRWGDALQPWPWFVKQYYAQRGPQDDIFTVAFGFVVGGVFLGGMFVLGEGGGTEIMGIMSFLCLAVAGLLTWSGVRSNKRIKLMLLRGPSPFKNG